MAMKKKKVVRRQVVEIVKRTGPEENAKDPTQMPNTYKFAAEALKTMSERSGSAGSIVVSKYKSYNYKLIYALVMNTAKNIKIIKKIIHNIKLMNEINEPNPFIMEILVGDLLFGKGLKSVSKNPVAAAILNKKDAIVKEQAELKKEFSQDRNDQFMAKYLRVNHLKCDMDHVKSQLKSIGITQLEYSKEKIKFKKFINKFKTLEDDKFMVDFHFHEDLIIVKPSITDKLKKLDLLRKNKILFQDKASYLAVEALNPQPNQKIIDACFAPGCKTSLIAAKMKNKGKILAYDINKKRLTSAIRFLKLQGASCVITELKDFTKVKLRRLNKVVGIETFDSLLLDPSCSGSGIASRVDYKKSDEEAGRLKKLQAFQVSMLKHALQSRIVHHIVYCTCSTSVEENEQVIDMALKESGVGDKWEVVEILPYWPSRGDPSYEFGSKCVRSDPNLLTNGFFIAKLKCNDVFTPAQAKNSKRNNKRKSHDPDESMSDQSGGDESKNGEGDSDQEHPDSNLENEEHDQSDQSSESSFSGDDDSTMNASN